VRLKNNASMEEPIMASELSKAELTRLARLGAQARLAELEAERRVILRAFPDLTVAAPRPGVASGTATTAPPKKKARKRRKMTAAEKKAVSERMKKFWAARKQQA
jgi:hypothetical protein